MIDTKNKAKASFHLSGGTTVRGTLNIRKYNRLSDYLNSKETDQFLNIVDATLNGKDEKVVIINRDKIVWAAPEE